MTIDLSQGPSGTRLPDGSSFAMGTPAPVRRYVKFFAPGTHEWTCPANVWTVYREAVAGGGGGGSTASATLGSEGGGGGEGAVGTIRVIPGETYDIVVGANGNGGAGNANGAIGGDTYMYGRTTRGSDLMLLGGVGGSLSTGLGTGGGLVGDVTSAFGEVQKEGGDGGNGGSGVDGLAGVTVDRWAGGRGGVVTGGTVGGGGGGGASLFGMGADGGAGNAAGVDAATQNGGYSGAGGGGAGADSGVAGEGGGDGGEGFLRLTWDE